MLKTNQKLQHFISTFAQYVQYFDYRLQEWIDKKKNDSKVGEDQYKFVFDKAGFDEVDVNKVDYLLGISIHI